MRVDIDCGKYTYVFKDGRARLLRYGEPTSRDVVGDKLIYCMAAEIETVRQQLASLTAQCKKIVKLKHLMSYNDSYFGEPAGDLKRIVYEIERSMPEKEQGK